MANANFTCVLDAWNDGKVLYGRMHYYRSGSYYYSDSSFPNPTMNLGGTTYTDTDFGNRVRSGIYVGDVYSTTFSRTVAGSGSRTVTWTAGSGSRSDFAGTWSKSVIIPEDYNPPTGLSVSVAEVYTDGAKFNVSISSYGNPSSANNRYIEASILNQNSYGESYVYQIAYNTTSSSITVNHNSYRGGSLYTQANKQYYYGCYANNTQASASKIQGQFVTLAYAPTITVDPMDSTSIRVNYSLKADGGYYAKKVQYFINDITSEWTTAATVSTGSATNGSFVVTGLQPDRSYILYTRVLTDVGYEKVIETVFQTYKTYMHQCGLYGSVSDNSRVVNKLYGLGGTVSNVSGTVDSGTVFTGFNASSFETNIMSLANPALTSAPTKVVFSYDQGEDSCSLTVNTSTGTSTIFSGKPTITLYIRSQKLGLTGLPAWTQSYIMGDTKPSVSDSITLTADYDLGSVLVNRLYGQTGGKAKLIHQSFGHIDYN